jgi:hypothetical protein
MPSTAPPRGGHGWRGGRRGGGSTPHGQTADSAPRQPRRAQLASRNNSPFDAEDRDLGAALNGRERTETRIAALARLHACLAAAANARCAHHTLCTQPRTAKGMLHNMVPQQCFASLIECSELLCMLPAPLPHCQRMTVTCHRRPAHAAALLQHLLPRWPQLITCLWEEDARLPVAAAPLLGMIGGLVASRAAAMVADTDPEQQPAAAGPAAAAAAAAGETASTTTVTPPATCAALLLPAPPPGLVFEWLLPLLIGRVLLPSGTPAPPQLRSLLAKAAAYALQQLPGTRVKQPLQQQQADPSKSGVNGEQGGDCTASSTLPAESTRGTTRGRELLDPRGPPPLAAAALAQLRCHAAAALHTAQEMLEDETTPRSLLAPLLQLLLEALRVDPAAVDQGGCAANGMAGYSCV